MTFKDLSVGDKFNFANPSSWASSRTLKKISSRGYIDIDEPSVKYKVGSINVRVMLANPSSKSDIKIRLINGSKCQFKAILRKAGFVIGQIRKKKRK